MPHTQRAVDWFTENSGIFTGVDSMLYVGFRSDSPTWWIDTFGRKMLGTRRFGVVEIFEKNCELVRGKFNDIECFHADVRCLDDTIVGMSWDMIFWDHGPEHVSTVDLIAVTPSLMVAARKWLLYCCPWGVWPQGALYDNEHERHYPVYPETFEGLGMTTVRLGTVDQSSAQPGELIAYSGRT